MKSRQYSDEFKEKIIQECQEVGNVALVARRYEISPNTIHTWLRKYRQLGTVRSLKRGELANVNPDLARVGYYSAFFVKPSRFSPGGFIKREFWQVQQ